MKARPFLRCSIPAVAFVMTSGAMACENIGARETPLETRRPVAGTSTRLTAGFGMRAHPLTNQQRLHSGVDWAAPEGTPVVATGHGRVISATQDAISGNVVLIDHGGGWQTLYAHLLSFSVSPGDCVRSGDVIAAVGITGLSAGSHLHYEVHRNGTPIDPLLAPITQKANR